MPLKSKRRKALGRAPAIGRPRLFGGIIEEYVEVCDARNFICTKLNIHFYTLRILLNG